jgi:hypothetical protein
MVTVAGFTLTDHAQLRMRERGIGQAMIDNVMRSGELQSYGKLWRKHNKGIGIVLDLVGSRIVTVYIKKERETASAT